MPRSKQTRALQDLTSSQQEVLNDSPDTLEEPTPTTDPATQPTVEPNRNIEDLTKKVEDLNLSEPPLETAFKNAVAPEPDLSSTGGMTREEEQAFIGKAQRLLQNDKDARRKYDKDWLARDLFRRGYHYIAQNFKNGSVSLSSTSRAKIPINLTWAYIRAIKNQVTSYQPKFEVLPEYKGKTAEENARMTGKLLDYIFTKNNMAKKIKEAIIQGLTYSVGGPFEVVWDANFDNGPKKPRGEIRINLNDPYDVYIDAYATEMEDAEHIIKAVNTPTDVIKNNVKYRESARNKLTMSTMKMAESEYKQFLLQTIHSGTFPSRDSENVILYEMQIKERKGDETKVRFFTWVDGVNEPLQNELIDQEDFDLEFFQADMNPLEVYGDSWAKHVIATNRVINALESSVFEYNYRYAKGRLVIDKNAGVKAVNNEHGSIIEKNPNSTVTSLPLAPLPSTTENQIQRMHRYGQDISGIQDAMLGRVPTGISSGIGIAELKQSSTSNQDDLVQALEDCLKRLAVKILRKAALHYDTPRLAKVFGNNRMVEHFAVVGQGYVEEGKKEWAVDSEKYPLAQIAYNNEVSVQIGSWLAYSKEGRQKMLTDLAKAGVIDQETLLNNLEFPDVQSIVDKTRAQKIIELKRKESPDMPSGINQEALALAENEMLDEGNAMPVDPETDDHQLHIAVHTQGMGGGDNQLYLSHIQEHRRAEQGGGKPLNPPQQGQPTPPPPPGGVPPQPQPNQAPVQSQGVPMPLPPVQPTQGGL